MKTKDREVLGRYRTKPSKTKARSSWQPETVDYASINPVQPATKVRSFKFVHEL